MEQGEKDLLIDYLRRESRNISRCARSGWDCANKIINYYDLVYSCPGDETAWFLLNEAVKEYKEMILSERL